MIILVPLLFLVGFLVLGMPIVFALGISGSIGLIIYGGLDSFMGVMMTTPYASVSSFTLSAIPMFILMASFMTASGITKDLFYSTNKWFGNLPGGLAIATVIAGAGMGAVSGSSTASAATMAKAAAPEMRRYKYSPELTMGVISIAGTLALLIPPSIVLIIYGSITETGVGALLIAGIIPGILTALSYILVILTWVKFRPEIAPRIPVKPSIKERVLSLSKVWPMLVVVTAVIGGIYSGIVTPTEAGALGALITLVLIFIMKKLTLKNLNESLVDTIKSTTMILTIIISAHVFGYFLTITQMTQKLVVFVNDLEISRYVILIFIVLIYLILGFFLDQIAILILTLPLTFPIIIALGFDPIWFGIIVTKAAEIGLVTPPVGMNVFVASSAAGEKTTVAFKGVFWFVIMEFILLAILIAIPTLTTWLPSLMMSN